MSEMVERVAREIAGAIVEDPMSWRTAPGAVMEWSDETNDLVQVSPLGMKFDGEIDLMALARAAIAAMREPTDGMLAAAGSPGVFTTIGSPAISWPLMIDAALRESP